jgi:hypothetical protein
MPCHVFLQPISYVQVLVPCRNIDKPMPRSSSCLFFLTVQFMPFMTAYAFIKGKSSRPYSAEKILTTTDLPFTSSFLFDSVVLSSTHWMRAQHFYFHRFVVCARINSTVIYSLSHQREQEFEDFSFSNS